MPKADSAGDHFLGVDENRRKGRGENQADRIVGVRLFLGEQQQRDSVGGRQSWRKYHRRGEEADDCGAHVGQLVALLGRSLAWL